VKLDDIGQVALSHITAGGALLAFLFLAGSVAVPLFLN
jgi:hypothetical protein